ncbi:MAG: polar amino acid transport system substrate-binding protein [Actinomycetota bacterium]|nr:polar amino acid transport system substrate-binding protein [Actinomycetota bacterium]
MTQSRRFRTLTALAAVAAFLAAGCGSSDKPAGSAGDGDITDLGRRLPAAIIEAPNLDVGSDVAYAPVEFFEEGTQDVTGLDVDICAAVVAKFGGFTCRFMNTEFAGIIPALQAKRFDIVMSALSDTKERQQAIDLVDYFSAGTSILVAKGNPVGIRTLDDLCGKTIGLQKGTIQEDLANTQKTACQGRGSDLEVLTFEKDTDALLALKAGRSVADMNDFPVAAYNAKVSGDGKDFEVVGEQLGAGPYGIGVRKEDVVLRDVLRDALMAIVADGSYDRILAKWDVSQGALKTAAINGG